MDGFAAVVELAQQRLAELLEHVLEGEAPADLGVLVEERRHLGEGFEVLQDHLADPGPLDLDRHRPAVPQHRAVDLSQGSRGEGSGVEFEKSLRQAHAELAPDDLLHVAERERLDPVLQPGESVQIRRRQQVRARREELAELDERRPQGFEVLGELLRISGDLLGDLDVRQIDVDGLDQVRAPVLDQQAGEILVALQVLRLER